MVRDIATDARARRDVIQATIDDQPADRGVDQLVVMRDAFTAIGALSGYTASDTQVWTSVRPGLMDDLATMTSFGDASCLCGQVRTSGSRHRVPPSSAECRAYLGSWRAAVSILQRAVPAYGAPSGSTKPGTRF